MAAIRTHLVWISLVVFCLLTVSGPWLHLKGGFVVALLTAGLIHIVLIVWTRPEIRPLFIWSEFAAVLACVSSVGYYAVQASGLSKDSLSVLWTFVTLNFLTLEGIYHLSVFLGLFLLCSYLFTIASSFIIRKEPPGLRLLLQCIYASGALIPSIDYYVINQPLSTMAVFRPEEAEAFIFGATLAPLTEALVAFVLVLFSLGVFQHYRSSGVAP